ncbi:MAG: hypothetical protein IPJ65_38150 [Archangiaceae bacterium]|nr:hypothetical protein [Archangiaceae bacterium]
MTEKTFIERYEELVKENESLRLRLVAIDTQLEQAGGPPKHLYPIGDFCKVFSERVTLNTLDVVNMSKGQAYEYCAMESVKSLAITLAYRAFKEGYMDIGPRFSENTMEARLCLVKLK